MYFMKLKKTDIYNQNFKKEILILWYFFTREGKDGNILCSLKDIIEDTGFQVSRTKNSINDIFKSAIENLINVKYISSNMNIENIKINTRLKINFIKNNKQEYNCFNISSDFVMLQSDEMSSIYNYFINNKKEKTNIDNVLKLFLIIKSFMNMGDQNNPFCFPSIQKLEYFSGFSKPTILKIIDILQKINLLYVYDLGNYKTISGEIKKHPFVYTLSPTRKQILKNNISSFKNNYKMWI